jgi:hypothetical protein
MSDTIMPAIGSKEGLRKQFLRMSPEIRDEFLETGKREEREQHIQKEGEEFKTDLIPEKTFKTEIEVHQEVKRIFEENPRLSNYSELEQR